MIGFNTKGGSRGRPYWGNFWRAMMASYPNDERYDNVKIQNYINKCLERYSATLTLEHIEDYWIIAFKYEKDYLYFKMEWS